MPVKAPPKKTKASPDEPYDVIISVVHDDRAGKTAPVEKPVRRSFKTEEDALAFANKLKEVK